MKWYFSPFFSPLPRELSWLVMGLQRTLLVEGKYGADLHTPCTTARCHKCFSQREVLTLHTSTGAPWN